MTTDTIIFDLGRVLVSLTTAGEKFGALMRAMGIPPEQAFDKYWFAEEVRKHMTGEMSPREFYRAARDRFHLPHDFAAFAEAWCDLFVPKPEMAALFGELAERHGMGILSDTDPLHWERLRTLYPWLDRVAKPTLSFEVGYLKPHPAMYEAAVANSGQRKEQCLFIDDVAANVDGARYFGLPALLFEGEPKLRRALTELGVL